MVVSYHRHFLVLRARQTGDIARGAVHGSVLKPLAYAVEKHDADSLGIFADAERADAGYSHERELVEDIAAAHLAHSLADNRQSHRQKSDGIPYQSHRASGRPPRRPGMIQNDPRQQHDKRDRRQNKPPDPRLRAAVAMGVVVAVHVAMSVVGVVAMTAIVCGIVVSIVIMRHPILIL